MSSTKTGAVRHLQWTIVDGMILIATVSIGLVALREVHSSLDYGVTGSSNTRGIVLMT
jgi:hypothetical protein